MPLFLKKQHMTAQNAVAVSSILLVCRGWGYVTSILYDKVRFFDVFLEVSRNFITASDTISAKGSLKFL